MKISYVASSYSPFLNGVSFAVHRRSKWLLRRGHEVQLFRPQADSQFPDEVLRRDMPCRDELAAFGGFRDVAYPVRPHPLCRTYPVPLSSRHWNVDEHLESFQPDLILLEDVASLVGLISPFMGGYRKFIAADYARRTGVPSITLIETDYLKYSEMYIGSTAMRVIRPILAALIHRMSSAYDLNLMPTHDFVVRHEAVRMVRGNVLHFHGVDTSEFSPANLRFDPIPGDHRPMLLFVGRFVREKSVLELLEAFPLVLREMPDAHLVIIGSGPLEQKMRRQAARFGASVSFPGETYGDALKGWYARADVYVNPSVSESFCTANLEAVSSGTPVVAAAAGGHLDQLVPDRNGLFSRPHDPADLAAQVVALLTNPARLARITAQCHDSMRHLDWNVCCERLEGEMFRLIAERRGAPAPLARVA